YCDAESVSGTQLSCSTCEPDNKHAGTSQQPHLGFRDDYRIAGTDWSESRVVNIKRLRSGNALSEPNKVHLKRHGCRRRIREREGIQKTWIVKDHVGLHGNDAR